MSSRPLPTPPWGGVLSEWSYSNPPVPVPVQPAVSTPAPVADNHVFGLRQDGPVYTSPQPIFSDDYEKRFPEDAYCEENGPNARVYRTYVEEAAAYDANMVGQSRDGLDVMLVFAGLFSAVVTSFLVQVSQRLQADYMQMSAVLLYDLVFIQLALADSVSVTNITRPSANPAQAYVADGITVWVNGLWVVSLVASLTVALVAVLAKQWLHHYVSLPSGTPKHRSHIRHFRFMGLEQWRVLTIIGMLPIVMHISLTLFLSGLILFFIPLRQSLAWTVGTITVVVCILYLAVNAMPFFFPQCPYKTLFTEALHYIRHLLLASGPRLRRLVCRLMNILTHRNYSLRDPENYPTLMAIETHAVESDSDALSVDVFDWLFRMSSNPSVHSIVLQSIGGLHSSVARFARAKFESDRGMYRERSQMMQQCITSHVHEPTWSMCRPGCETKLERLCRSFPFLWGASCGSKPTLQLPCDVGLSFQATFWHPHLPFVTSEPMDYVNFFWMYPNVKLHSLVWVGLVDYAATFWLWAPSDPALSASYAKLLMVLLPFPYRYSDAEIVVTLREAVHRHLEPHIWKTLLLSNLFETVNDNSRDVCSSALPVRERFLIVAFKFALHGMKAAPTAVERRIHFELLNFVLLLFRDSTTESESPQFLAAVEELVIVVVENDPLVLSLMAGDELQLLVELQKGCLELTGGLYLRLSKAKLFSYPSFNIFMQFSMRPWFLSDAAFALDGQVIHGQRQACEVMHSALASGHEEAYCLFIDGKWMDVLSPLWVFNWAEDNDFEEYPEIIADYIHGLQLITSESARQSFVEHLHTPRNLIICFLTLYCDYDIRKLQKLIDLRPDHPSWAGCRYTMRAVLGWLRNPTREAADFPLLDFYGWRSVNWISFNDRLIGTLLHKDVGVLEKAIQLLDNTLTVSQTPT